MTCFIFGCLLLSFFLTATPLLVFPFFCCPLFISLFSRISCGAVKYLLCLLAVFLGACFSGNHSSCFYIVLHSLVSTFLRCTAKSCFYVVRQSLVSTLYGKVLFLRCTAKSCFYVVSAKSCFYVVLQSLVSTLYCKVLPGCKAAIGASGGRERNYCTFKQNGPHSPAAIFVQSWLQALAGWGN